MAKTLTLRDFASERQLEYLDAIEHYGSQRAAADALGVARGTIGNAMAALKMKVDESVEQNEEPLHTSSFVNGYVNGRLDGEAFFDPQPDGFKPVVPESFDIEGLSTYLGKDGQTAGQWVKVKRDAKRQKELLEEFAKSLASSVKALAPITPPPKYTSSDLLSVYPMGDPHVGLHAWWAESGEDFDLKIAEKLICSAVDRLVSVGPASETALLLNLGDMFHADNQKNESKSGHQLDVDSRWAKIQHVGLQAKLHCIRRLLEKHKKVVVRINRGNHDGHSAYALAMMLSCWFHAEPRVQVELTPAVTWYYQFGKVLIGSTHGDELKGPNMLPVMAADEPKKWGETIHRYWYVGHVHHQDMKEYPGGVVEYFRTLAARDAWHAGKGYRAGRDMRLIVHHIQHGEIERYRCDVGMIDL